MENTEFINYIFKASVAMAVFVVFYALCLRHDTFFRMRRFYLLLILFFTTLYPLLNLEIARPIEETGVSAMYWLSAIEINAGQTLVEQSSVDWVGIILIVLAVVSVVFLMKFLFQMWYIYRLKKYNESENWDSYSVVKLHKTEGVPFSFFNWIFVDADNKDQEKQVEIMIHEREHVRQLHTIDIVLAEIFVVAFWWNPLAWYIRREIRLNLEYLADEGVLKSGCNSREYQYLLLKVSTNINGISIINNFNVSQLKKRIAMMNKERTSLIKLLKYLAVVPIGALLLIGNAVQASENLTEKISSAVGLNVNETQNQLSADSASPKKDYAIGIAEVKGDIVSVQEPDQKKKVFNVVETMPAYPGGEQAMMEFIKNNLKYPKEAQDAKIEGRVTIRFVIDEEGFVTDANIMRGIDPACDKEALRVINTMPKWIPGKQNGKDVPVYFTLPIVFKLTKSGKEESLIRVRGVNTLDGEKSAKILYVVDGTEVESIHNIEPNDIKSVSVFKDALAIEKYGEKGKNGVVIIELKK